MGVAATSSEAVRMEVAELLGVSADDVDPDADLIASGLDSIRMMSLSGRWRKLGIDVGFAALAANPTVAAWSDLVTKRSTDAHSPATVGSADTGDASDPFPLAPMQHAMWLGRNAEQQLGGVAAHLYVEFDGAGVDPERVGTAAAKLAARHPMLRVEIQPDGTQRIGDRELGVTVYDLRELDGDAAEERLLAIRDEKSHQLLESDMLELSLSLRPDGRTRLHVDMDMQAADAVSYRKFMADLAVFYGGGELPELEYTYREYRAAMAASDPGPSEEDRQWWAERVPELPEPPALPLVPSPADPRRSVRLWHIFDVETRDALFAAAHRRGLTPAMAVAASYSNALAKWSTNSRFLLNLPMFGREPFHADVEKLVGCFTSSLMLDIDLTQSDTPSARARAVQETLHSTASHSSYSGLSVLRDLGRHRGNQTLAPIVYTSALGLGDLFAGEVTDQFGVPVWTISQGPQVLIDAQATPLANGLMINWDVRLDAFRPGVADTMFAYHLAELSRLATDDSAWDTPDPPAVPEAARAIREAVNSTTASPSGEALHDGFFRNALATPDAPALFSGDGDLTYGELRKQALAVAAALRENGVRPGDLVALVGTKCAEQIPAALGILAVGGAYLPIGADQPAERTARILESSGVAAVLICGAGDPVAAAPDVPTITVADAISRDADDEPGPVHPSALAYVLFTSGSTGEPKGVELTHDAVMNTVEFVNGHFGLESTDRSLALASLEADMSVLEIFAILRAGGAVVVVDEQDRRDPDTWARLIERHSVTFLNWMPGWLDMLLEVGGARLSSLRVVLLGGDWVRPELIRGLRKSSPAVRAAGLGGATETAVHGTICEVDDPPAHWASVPYGTPFPNNSCRVVAADGSDCPDWVPGELWFAGRGIARGYRGRPDLTAEKFVEHEGRTWYRTGDLVRYLPDGSLEFVGRIDHRIKISGYRIELGEVEAALKRVTGVEVAVAAVIPGEQDVLAALVRVEDAGVDSRAVTAAMAELVPAHMIPKVVVVTDRIPFTVAGKIDRKAVARQLAEAELPAAQAYRSPSGPLESALAAIVGEVLGLSREEPVGVDDDFFALGGDSVLATQVVARIRDWLDTPTVVVADMFATRTVSALADRLAGRERGSERLNAVAEVYLEIAEMDGADVLSALESSA